MMAKAAKTSRKEIRTAAFHRFRERGFHKTTVDQICEQAGISKGSFYHWYDTKQAVFADILASWADVVVGEVREQFLEALDGEDTWESIADALVREIHRGRALMPLWLEFQLAARRDPAIGAVLSQFYARIRNSIAEILAPSLGQYMSPAEVNAVAAAIFGGFSGLVIQDLADPAISDATATVRLFMTAVPRWIAAATGQTR